jgi:peptide/nickel transport system permease protein
VTVLRALGAADARAATTLILVLIAAFFLTGVAYRDPANMLAPRNATQEGIDAVTRALRLDDPWYVQLKNYLLRGPDIQGAPMGLAHWPPGLGYSFRRQTAVTELILSKVPVTVSLALGALVIWMTLSIVSGVAAARRRGTAVDRGLSTAAYIALSLPTFLTGMLLSYGLYWFPSSGYVPFAESPIEWARHLLLPWLTLAIAEIGLFQRVVRGSVLEALSADYIRTARAKGVSENAVYYRHALKSALNPVITLGGLELAVIMGGAIVTETVFGLDGVGRLAINSALESDFPVVIGTTIFAAAVFVLCNLVVDIVTRLRDPAAR